MNMNVNLPKFKIIRYTIIMMLLYVTPASAQADYLLFPSYESVIEYFFNTYSTTDLGEYDKLNFEKRPTGWHVTIYNYNNNQYTHDNLFWDSKRKKFIKTDYEELKDWRINIKILNTYKKNYEKVYFNICPYYGYKGWDKDVIDLLKNSENLPDSTLYALGRAYSSFASNLLNNNSGYADKQYQFSLKPGKNSLNREQLETYRYYRHKAIKKYNQLSSLNPDYKTIVGEISIKAANEYVTAFLDLRTYQNEEEAQKELIDGLYSEFMLSTAKNYLNSCEKNSILFTNGDNDTYPLLYVQANQGVRTDVLVTNISLLQTEDYINSLRDPILDAPPLPVSFTTDKFKNDSLSFMLIRDESDTIMDLDVVINFVKNNKKLKRVGNKKFSYIPTYELKFSTNEQTMKWKLKDNYILRSHLIILDCIKNSNWTRPIYFAVTMDSDNFIGLNDYLKHEGLAYKLTSQLKDMKNNNLGEVNTSVMFNNIMNNFEWEGINKILPGEKSLGLNYRNIFHRLTEALIDENKHDSAKLVLDKCISLFPDEIIYYDKFVLHILYHYYTLKEFEIANGIARKLIYNVKNNYHNKIFFDIKSEEEEKSQILDSIKFFAEKFNQIEIQKLLNESK